MTLCGGAFSGAPKPGIQVPGIKVQDPTLDALVTKTRAKIETLDFLKTELLDPATTRPAQVLEGQLKAAEIDVAKSITETTNYVAVNAWT